MKKSLKVVLFSGFVFPGVGHYMLKKYYRALMFSISFAVVLTVYANDVFNKAQQLVQQIQQGSVALDAVAITKALENLTIGFSQQQLSWLGYTLLLIWLLAIVDAYRIATKEITKVDE